ncbi:hypothetical protein BJX99DRAFT_257806 [Aspergillus californicus]
MNSNAKRGRKTGGGRTPIKRVRTENTHRTRSTTAKERSDPDPPPGSAPAPLVQPFQGNGNTLPVPAQPHANIKKTAPWKKKAAERATVDHEEWDYLHSHWTTIPKGKHTVWMKLLTAEIFDASQVRQYTGTRKAPAHRPRAKMKKFKAVCLNSESVQVNCTGRRTDPATQYIVQLCAVDVLSGKKLLDIVVAPEKDMKVVRWLTRSSGISPTKYAAYKRRGDYAACLAEAQDQLFQYIDERTIIIGHALHCDLNALSISHRRVVDTQVLTTDVVRAETGKRVDPFALERVSSELLRISTGHDCLEDAYAPREILCFWFDEENTAKRITWISETAAMARDYAADQTTQTNVLGDVVERMKTSEATEDIETVPHENIHEATAASAPVGEKEREPSAICKWFTRFRR